MIRKLSNTVSKELVKDIFSYDSWIQTDAQCTHQDVRKLLKVLKAL